MIIKFIIHVQYDHFPKSVNETNGTCNHFNRHLGSELCSNSRISLGIAEATSLNWT